MPYSISSVYEPVTFQEMITPNLIAKEELEKKSEGYLKLLEDMKSIEDLKDSQIDKEDYDRYMEFKGRINDMVNRIADNDISKDVIRNLSKYKAEYQNDFAGLVDKIKRRGELVKEQRAFNVQHPDSFFDTDYSNVAARNVGENSSYNVYDMTSAASDVAGMIYSALSSGEGKVDESVVNSIIDAVKNKYNFDGLSNVNQRKVINAINKGFTAGQTTYTEAAQKNALNDMKLKKLQADTFKSMYGKYMGTGQPIKSSSGGKSSNNAMIIRMPDRNNVKFTPSKDVNGNTYYEYTTVDGNKKILTEREFRAVQDEVANNMDKGITGPLTAKFYVDYFGGYTPSSYSGNKFGVDITVYEKDGMLYVMNSRNKYVPVNGTSDSAIYSAYTGTPIDALPLYIQSGSDTAGVAYYDGDTTMPVDTKEFDSNINTEKTLFADNIKNISTLNDLRTLDNTHNVSDNVKEYIRNVANTSDSEAGMQILERAGFHIVLSEYYKNNKKDKFRGYKIELKRNDSGDVAQVNQQNQQTQPDMNSVEQAAPSYERNDTAAVTSTEAYDD